MADGGREKRLKSSEDDEDRIAVADEHINREHMQGQVQQGHGQHGPPPNDHPLSFAVHAAVDLSRVDASLVKHIFSFLGTSRELLNLALTCKSFGWRETGHADTTPNLSLVEDIARQAVCLRATDEEMSYLPRYARGTATWLLILHRFEHLLLFDTLLGRHIEHPNEDKTTVQGTHAFSGGSAVASHYVMRKGEQYAEFRLTGSSMPCVGIVRPMPKLDASNFRDEVCFGDPNLYPAFLAQAQKTREWGGDNVHACYYLAHNGHTFSTNWEDFEEFGWPDEVERCFCGDTVGMLLDLDRGTLTLYRNNRLQAVIADGLSGPFCWCVFVDDDGAVAIRGQNKALKGQRTLFDYEFSRTTVRGRPPLGQN